ncbi:hypothetical protein HPP92_005189 [Vanilla planifolia]|uniref:Uncharacterized protein n=1 Tax=Vanilla planifolia TaxID=51239 RepID=A0A835RKX0_VANPL|nr:hypothetical protein HPP92_005189 [Vanilla planifolia]
MPTSTGSSYNDPYRRSTIYPDRRIQTLLRHWSMHSAAHHTTPTPKARDELTVAGRSSRVICYSDSGSNSAP